MEKNKREAVGIVPSLVKPKSQALGVIPKGKKSESGGMGIAPQLARFVLLRLSLFTGITFICHKKAANQAIPLPIGYI